jgi:phage gp36-like protein
MAYCKDSDLTARLPVAQQIRMFADKAKPSDPEPTAINLAILQPIIEEVTTLMDSYIRRHYAVPLGDRGDPAHPVPQDVIAAAVKLVIHEGYKRKGAVPEEIKDEHDAVIRWLENVAKGICDIGQEPPPTVNARRGIEYSTQERILTRDKLQGVI